MLQIDDREYALFYYINKRKVVKVVVKFVCQTMNVHEWSI